MTSDELTHIKQQARDRANEWSKIRIEKLLEEIERLKSMSTIEMMCENESVRQHVEEWEKRCLKSEAENARLREALKRHIQFLKIYTERNPLIHYNSANAAMKDLLSEAEAALQPAKEKE